MKKKLLSLFLALTLTLSLAACGGNNVAAAPDASSGGSASSAVSGSEEGASSAPEEDGAEIPEEDVPLEDEVSEPDTKPDPPDQTPSKPAGGGSSAGGGKPAGGDASNSAGKPPAPSGGGDTSGEAPAAVDLSKFYTDTAASLTDAPGLMEVSADLIEGLYPGLTALKPKQQVAYMAMISAVACEVVALEMNSAEDAKAAKAILQTRITQQGEEQGAFYPDAVDQWQNHSQLLVNGKYVLMAVGTGSEAFAANFNALTQ